MSAEIDERVVHIAGHMSLSQAGSCRFWYAEAETRPQNSITSGFAWVTWRSGSIEAQGKMGLCMYLISGAAEYLWVGP